MESTTKLTIRVRHRSCIPGALWCRPVGWSPRNAVEGADWDDDTGAWWGDDGEAAAIIVLGFDEANHDRRVCAEVSLTDLRVVSAGDGRVIGGVEIDFA
jgi:hypothetical protein